MDATATFFAGLDQRGHDPRLHRVSGTVRFDLDQGSAGQHWLVSITKGEIGVSELSGSANQRQPAADAVIHADRKQFNRILTGEANAMASMLRGLVGVEGDPELVVLIQRLFTREPVGSGTRG